MMLAEKLGSIPGADTIQYNMTQDEFILKSFDVIAQYGKAEGTCIKILSKTIGVPMMEIKRVLADNKRYLTVWNRKPIDATEEELLNFPAYTWENLSEEEKQWHNENNTKEQVI